MEVIGGEISSKIRAAIKAKLMEMGAYVDEELPDYVMVMVANKRSKAQMSDDLQLFLGKSTEQFTNWLQQVLNKLQEVATVNNKALTDTKKVQSRTSPSEEAAHEAKPASKLRSERVAEPKAEHIPERASGHRSEKRRAAVDGKDRRVGARGAGAKAASSKTKIFPMNSGDEDNEDEDFINIKADAEAEALLKAELPASARQLPAVAAVAAADAACESGCPPSEAARDVTAALAHGTSGAQKVRPTVRRVVTAPTSTVTVTKRSAGGEDAGGLAKRAAVCTGEEGAPRRSVAVTDRLGVRPSIKERLGTRGGAATPASGNPTAAGAGVADRPGAGKDGAASRKRPAEAAGGPEVVTKRPAVEGGSGGSRLARRLRELAEGPSGGARVAHVPPHNIRQGSATERRPSINSQVVHPGLRGTAAEVRDAEGEAAPAVALPSVVRVTPRPRLPAALQANKNLLLKAVAEAQRSVAAAAAASASCTVDSPRAARNRREGRRSRSRLVVGAYLQEEDRGGRECEEEEEEEEEEDCGNDGEGAPENTAGQFTLGFLNRQNFAVTVSNESGTAGESEAEEQSDDGGRRARGSGKRRQVVAAPGKPRESGDASAAAGAPQQITVRLSPEGSHDGDSSSEREEEEEAVQLPPLSAAAKGDTRSYGGRPPLDNDNENDYEYEDDDEGPAAAAVAAVRPTVVTTVPHMDVETVTRSNPQFVVTLDGVDVSKFPNAGTDDDECPVDSGRATDCDVSKEDSGGAGAGQSSGTPATGRATVVQRVEPRLRLGPMPTPSRQRQDAGGELTSAGLSSGSGVAPTKTAERCKFWPACRLGAKCAFHHPTLACRVFPACKFGEKCLYIHPNCKFDAACTRRDCPYTHSSPRLSAAAAARGPAHPGSGGAVCRFFPGCTNPACRFLHPKACKYGRYCVKLGCTFQHDGIPTTDKLKWVCPFRA